MIVVAATSLSLTTASTAQAGAVLRVAPGATGDCVRSACGSIAEAVAKATEGGTIELAGGTYAKQRVAVPRGRSNRNVVVRPTPGAAVTLKGLDVSSPSVTFAALRVRGALHLLPGADHVRLEALTVAGPTFVVGAHDVTLVGNRLAPGPDDDALQIKPPLTGGQSPRRVLVEGNELGPALRRPGSDHHSDSLQVLGVEGLTLRGNLIHEAHSLSVLLKPDMGMIRDVDVVDNVVARCAPRREECGGWFGLMVETAAYPIRDLRVSQNTIAGASLRSVPGLVVRRNVFSERSLGSPEVRDNLVHVDSLNLDASNLRGVPVFAPDGMTLAPGAPGAGWGARMIVPHHTAGLTWMQSATVFPDVGRGGWLDEPVRWLVEHAITTGDARGLFRPSEPVSRGQMSAFLWRLMDQPAVARSHGMGDVPAEAYYGQAVRWLVASEDAPSAWRRVGSPRVDHVTRAQMATFLWRLVGAPSGAPGHGFRDVGPEHPSGSAIAWLRGSGVTTGVAEDRFDPSGTVTRGQMAVFLPTASGPAVICGRPRRPFRALSSCAELPYPVPHPGSPWPPGGAGGIVPGFGWFTRRWPASVRFTRSAGSRDATPRVEPTPAATRPR